MTEENKQHGNLPFFAHHKGFDSSPGYVAAPANIEIPLSQKQFSLVYPEINESLGVYNWLISMEIEGDLNLQAFESSLKLLMIQYENLRTGIHIQNQQQIIFHPNSDYVRNWKLIVEKESFLGLSLQDQNLITFKNKFAQEKFALDGSQILSASTLVKLGPKKYLWLYKIHHALFDGGSQGIFLTKLSQAYALFEKDLEMVVVKAHVFVGQEGVWQYKDFLSWQDSTIIPERFSNEQEYWKAKLTDFERLQLPLARDIARPVKPNYAAGQRQAIKLDAGVVLKLQKLAENYKTSLYGVAMSVFLLVLQKYSGQKDLCLGTLTANRHAAKDRVKNTQGFIANVIPFRASLAEFEKLSFVGLLERVRDTIQESIYQNSVVPFNQIIEGLNLGRKIGYHPIFDILFVQQKEDYQALDLSGLKVTADESGWGVARFDLVLELRKMKDGTYQGFFEFNSVLFDEKIIQLMAENFKFIAKQACEFPYQALDKLQFLSAEERALIKEMSIGQRNPAALSKCLHEIFENILQKESIQQKAAVIFADELTSETLSFQTLNIRANQLAHYLVAKGIKPGDFVALCMERSIEAIIAILAIWKAGAAVMPLEDSVSAQAVVAKKIVSGKPKLILVQEQTKFLIPMLAQNTMTVFERLGVSSSFNEFSSENLQVSVKPEHPAAVIYTSGTTGEPKGVVCDHGGYSNWCAYLASENFTSSDEVVYSSMPLIFDAGLIWESFCLSLLQGATLVLTPNNKRLDMEVLRRVFKSYQVSMVTFTPSTFVDFEAIMPTLRKVFLTAEKLPVDLVTKLRAKNIEVINAYGPTEASLGVSLNRKNPYCIGGPIANREMLILDEEHKLVPMGAWGQMFIGGPNLATYLDVSHEEGRFFNIPDPFSLNPTTAPLVRVFNTGDSMCLFPDGNYAIRTLNSNRRVKRYGRGIELQKVEWALSQFPMIEQVAVKAWGQGQDMYLAAYIVLKPGLQLDIDGWLKIKKEMREHGMASLELPDVYIILTELPLTATGKLHYQGLPLPDKDSSNTRSSLRKLSYVPQDKVGKMLVAIWKDVLQVPIVFEDDYFDEIGGNSFRFITLINRINRIILPNFVEKLQIKHFPTLKASSHSENAPAVAQDFTIKELLSLVESCRSKGKRKVEIVSAAVQFQAEKSGVSVEEVQKERELVKAREHEVFSDIMSALNLSARKK